MQLFKKQYKLVGVMFGFQGFNDSYKDLSDWRDVNDFSDINTKEREERDKVVIHERFIEADKNDIDSVFYGQYSDLIDKINSIPN